ncbi:MAG: tetratricopeptide repeat protein [Caldilineales bacterium]
MLAQLGPEPPPPPDPIALDELWRAAAQPGPESDNGVAPAQPPGAARAAGVADPLLVVPEPAPPAPLPDQVEDVGALLAGLAEAAPEDSLAQARLGAFAVQSGEGLEVAGEHFQRAIDLDPTAWLAYGLWADGLNSSGLVTESLQLVDQGLAAIPDSAPLVALHGRLTADASPTADDALNTALENGRAALQDRNWADAVAAGQRAVAAAPERFEAHLLLGDAYRGAGELAQAVVVYQRAVELAPQLSILHARVGETEARLGRADEAVGNSLTALAIDQSRWENWYALGRAYAAQAALAGSDADGASARLAESALQRAAELAPPENEAPQRALQDLRAGL